MNADGTLTIPHSLGSAPGCIMIKVYSGDTGLWRVYHRSATNNLILNETGAQTGNYFGNVTDASFDLISTGFIGNNRSNLSFTIYLFAHDAGGYGDDGTENIISCGSFNSTALTNLGWEPQWVMMKRIDSTSGWFMVDDIRGMTASTNTTTYLGTSPYLYANSAQVETAGTGLIAPAATGFGSGQSGTYIYIAIRRPMKTPEAGTEVFTPVHPSASGTFTSISGFPTDFTMNKGTGAGDANYTGSRLQGVNAMQPQTTAAEFSVGFAYDFMDRITIAGSGNYSSWISWNFKRATGFMDVVAYKGSGSATTQAHNLGVVPEMMIVKRRNATDLWPVYHATLGNTKYLQLNGDVAEAAWDGNWNNTTPTASVFSLGSGSYTNASSSTYVAYLFASAAGVSKVGSYTGTGSSLNVDCGFTGGARFILIRRYNYPSGGSDWYVYDSTRGISALGTDDPYLFINTTAAQVTNTDYVASLSAGFNVTSNASSTINVNGGTYIFLAIA